jgi:predicted ATPase/transcriptional regulator with XRE-family HTH domain
MEQDVSFGLWLQKRRKALDLTREELAHKVGCSASALRKIESNQRHPSKQLAELLAYALSIPETEQPVFLRIARGEHPWDKLQSLPPLPNLHLLQSHETFSKHIPLPPTSIVGRDHEMAAIHQMLGQPHCRLVTLVGPGGSGKTRLAIEVAHNLGTTFLHGIVFVPLAGLTSPDQIFPAIAKALDLKLDGSSLPDQQLFDHLKGKEILLLLDNLEHLLDGAAKISEMIEYAPMIKVLCTSREQLNLHGEWVFEVRGLSVPRSTEGTEFEQNSAVTLFLQRARQVKPALSMNHEDRMAIVSICKLVEGMPLAIELSAVWTRTLPLPEIAREIEKSLDFLSTNVRDIPERHRSLRAVFNHSWKRLKSEERDVLMKLSLFRGGFTRELAEQVAQANLSLLSALIMKSLIHWTDKERYDLHETIRQYALIQLVRANMSMQTRNAYLQTFIRLAEMIEPKLTGSEQERWLAYLETEHDNFRAALQWAFEAGDTTSSLRLTGALWRFWYMRSYFVEGSQWLERALQSRDPASSALRAKVLNGAGLLAYYQNQFDKAKSKLEECLALRSHLSERDIAYAQLTIAYVIHDQLDFKRASSLYEDALQRFRRLNDTYGIIRALNSQGVLALDTGDLDKATNLFGECLALARTSDDRGNVAIAITNLGWTAAIGGDVMAICYGQEALMLYRELGNKLGVAFCLEGIGAGHIVAGQSERAVQLIGAAHALRRTISALPSGTHFHHIETILEKARNTMSDTAFTSAWRAGEAMSLEQAIEYAMEN